MYKDLAQVARVPALHEDEPCTRSLAQELWVQVSHAKLWVQALHKNEPCTRTLHKRLRRRHCMQSFGCRPCMTMSLARGPCTRGSGQGIAQGLALHKVLAQDVQVQALHKDELCTRSLAQRASGAGVAHKALSVGLAQGPCTRGSGAGLAQG